MAQQEWECQPHDNSPELLRFATNNNSNKQQQLTVLASYPRCGNSLLRSLCERLTGAVTNNPAREKAPFHDPALHRFHEAGLASGPLRG